MRKTCQEKKNERRINNEKMSTQEVEKYICIQAYGATGVVGRSSTTAAAVDCFPFQMEGTESNQQHL